MSEESVLERIIVEPTDELLDVQGIGLRTVTQPCDARQTFIMGWMEMDKQARCEWLGELSRIWFQIYGTPVGVTAISQGPEGRFAEYAIWSGVDEAGKPKLAFGGYELNSTEVY